MTCDGIDSGPAIYPRLINLVGFDKARGNGRLAGVDDNGRFRTPIRDLPGY
jgi:hypothetical protein